MQFCQKCGAKVPPSPPVYQKKRKTWVLVLLWVFFLPVMAVIAVARSRKLKRGMKAILISAIVLISIVITFASQQPQTMAAFKNNDISSEASNSVSISADTKDESAEENVQDIPLFSDVITNDALRTDFFSACEQIGMDTSKIRDLKQADDWARGPRYSFTYLNMGFRLYCNMDSTVNTIKLGADTDIYKQGFEPYQVSDYIVDSSVADSLCILAEERVKSQLNYPATADFSWLDWSYGRERDLYSVSSSVTAKNAYGVESELPFTLIYQVDGDTATLLRFTLGGVEIMNNMDSVTIPERKEIAVTHNTEADNGEIILIEGQLGKYGKTVTVDGDEYINYYIPEGSYIVTNNGKWGKVFLAKGE